MFPGKHSAIVVSCSRMHGHSWIFLGCELNLHYILASVSDDMTHHLFPELMRAAILFLVQSVKLPVAFVVS